jgi:hypothetical protein
MKRSQNETILEYLKQGHSLTPLEALNLFGCFRLATRIFELKKDGVDIKTTIIHTGDKHYASYKLQEKERVQPSDSLPQVSPVRRELRSDSFCGQDELWQVGRSETASSRM